jgi:hypothetical protein
MIYAVMALSVLSVASGKLLESKPSKHIEIEIGQAYNENIPLLFKRFQHSKLTEMKRDTPYWEAPICQIRSAAAALLRQVTSLRHNSTE